MKLMIANPTKDGGDVQMWPLEWRAVLSTLPERTRGVSLHSIIKERLDSAGGSYPIRITLTNRQIESLRHAVEQLS